MRLRDKRDGRTDRQTEEYTTLSAFLLTGELSVCVVFRHATNVVGVKSVPNSSPICFVFSRYICCITLCLGVVVHASLCLQPTRTNSSHFCMDSDILSDDNARRLAVVNPESSLVVVIALSFFTVVRDWSSFSLSRDTSPSVDEVDVASTIVALSRLSVCRVYVAVFSQRRVIPSRTNTHRSASVYVRRLRQGVQPLRPPTNSPANAQWRTTVRLLRVWSRVCSRR